MAYLRSPESERSARSNTAAADTHLDLLSLCIFVMQFCVGFKDHSCDVFVFCFVGNEMFGAFLFPDGDGYGVLIATMALAIGLLLSYFKFRA